MRPPRATRIQPYLDSIAVLLRMLPAGGQLARIVERRVPDSTCDQVVTLSGHLMTYGQVRRAGRDASSVQGVKFVVNEIRAQVGVVTQ